MPRIFEEYVPGTAWEFGRVAFSRESILEFARRYDPQPFHVDPDGAARSIFGELIASGWHTGVETLRLMVDHVLSKTANLGSPGMTEVRWPRPVRVGDVISVRLTIADAVPSRSKPDRGIVSLLVETLNQRRETVMRFTMTLFVRRAGGQPR